MTQAAKDEEEQEEDGEEEGWLSLSSSPSEPLAFSPPALQQDKRLVFAFASPSCGPFHFRGAKEDGHSLRNTKREELDNTRRLNTYWILTSSEISVSSSFSFVPPVVVWAERLPLENGVR